MPVLNLADDIKIGSTQVDKVYLGATQVWAPAGGGGGIAFVASGGYAESPTNSYTFDIPMPSLSVGDVALLFAHYRNDAFAPAVSGWTQVYAASAAGGNDSGGCCFYRVVDGTEPANITITEASEGQAADYWSGAILGYSGVASVADTSANAHRIETATPAAFTGVLPTVGANDWVVYGMGHSHSASGTGTATVPTGTTERVNGNGTNNTALAVADYQPGSTPTAPTWSIASFPSNTYPILGAVVLVAS